MYNYIYFVSKPEIGLHILSYLKPENLEKPTKSTKNNIPELFWEGPQLQSQKNIGKTKKKQKKTIFWNSLGRTPHPEEYPNIVFFFWFFQVFLLVLHVSDPVEQLHFRTAFVDRASLHSVSLQCPVCLAPVLRLSRSTIRVAGSILSK